MKLTSRLWALLTALLLLTSAAVAQTYQEDAAAIEQKIQSLELEIQIADLQLQLARLNGDALSRFSAESYKESLQKEIDAQYALLSQLHAEHRSELTAQIDSLKAQNASLKEQIAENDRQISKLQAELNTLLDAEVPVTQVPVTEAPVFEEPVTEEPVIEEPAGEVIPVWRCFSASAKGLISKVTTTVWLDEYDCITEISVDASGETRGIATPVTQPEYLNQFIGLSIHDAQQVDTYSGATQTSQAVLEALADIAAQLPVCAEADEPVAEEPVAPEKPLSATARGFMSDVTVTVTLAGDVITAMQITANELDSFGQRYTDPSYTNQFIGLSIHNASQVDIITGVTITGRAVREALSSIAAQAPAAVAAPVEQNVQILTGTGLGFLNSDVSVTVTVNSNGRITAVKPDLSTQIPPICDAVLEEDFLSQFIGQTGPFAIGENVDVATSATFTSYGVIEAINNALGY